MKKIALTAAALVGLCVGGSASAADLAARPYVKSPVAEAAYNWSGFYLGVVAGANILNNTTVQGDEDLAYMPVNGRALGGNLGATLGYNWQFNRAVVGIEGDFSLFTGNTGHLLGYDETYYTQVRSNWLATIRGRAGYTFDNVLVYLTGGVAALNAAYTNIYDGFACNDTSEYSGCGTKTTWGLTAGAGMEYMLSRNLSLKAEYLYATFEHANICDANTAATTCSYPYIHSIDVNTVRAGLNYHFN